MKKLSLIEIDDLKIEREEFLNFIMLVSSGKRPDGTYNYCREALEIKAKDLLKNLKKL